MTPWIVGWAADRARKALLRPPTERHLLFAVCDHFEPGHGLAPPDVARARVRAWREAFPALAARFRDSAGRGPRHTVFFPGEAYDPRLVEPLAELVQAGHAEIEVHLHHDGDTRASLEEKLRRTLASLGQHGVVARRSGKAAWAFIHGNWALANGRPDGRWCGVDDELTLLGELGCYADFTFPSAPDPCQPAIVNRIYYARDDARRRAYDRADRKPPPAKGAGNGGRVLLVEGPLALARREPRSPSRGRRLGLRLESGALDAGDPPSRARLRTWIEQFVHVDGRPEWTFVKVHTHGAPEKNARVLLGEAMADLHAALGELASGVEGPPEAAGWRVHYVTAREMYNVARAAMDGMRGSPAAYIDYDVPPADRGRMQPT